MGIGRCMRKGSGIPFHTVQRLRRAACDPESAAGSMPIEGWPTPLSAGEDPMAKMLRMLGDESAEQRSYRVQMLAAVQVASEALLRVAKTAEGVQDTLHEIQRDGIRANMI